MSGFGPKVTPLHGVRNWLSACQTTKGGPLPNLHNVLLALRNDPEFTGKLRFDEMLYAVVAPDAPIEDIDVFRIHEWLQQNGLRRVGLDAVREAIEIVARETRFHPLRDWLNGLTWDGSPRTTDWLVTYLGAAQDDYHQDIGPRFLISMVARAMQPGCQADYMIVLEGPQGILKSQACRALAGQYFSDTLPDLGGDAVRVSMHLRGKWLIEVSELSAFSKAEATKLKAFLTTQTEQYTPKFGRYEVHEPRQCVFVGTTNDDHYLRDPSGGRRFWPVKCGKIDADGIARDREQLFAEALYAYQRDARWWPDPEFEEKHIRPVQETRYETDAWERPILEFLDKPLLTTTLVDVAYGALGLPKDRLGTRETRRITAILRAAGWKQYSTGKTREWKP